MISLLKEKRKIRRKTERGLSRFRLTPEILLSAVCDIWGIKQSELTSRSRNGEYVEARTVYSYIGRESKLELKELGRTINRDHSTIHFHWNKARWLIDPKSAWYDRQLAINIDLVEKRLDELLQYRI